MHTTTEGDNIELVSPQQHTWSDQGHDAQSLPRADGGRDAWLFLTASFLFEALIWGFPFSFGVWQNYYATHEPFASQGGGIATIGTTALGCMYFAAPLCAFMLQRYPRTNRPSMIVGVVIVVLSLLAASFCSTITSLIATQGVMYAVGGLAAYFPAMSLLDDWFVARKSLAFGVMWAGGGLAGAVMPFLVQWLLDAYGFRTALRVCAVFMAVLLVPAIYFIKPRVPIPAASAPRPYDLTFLAHAPFWWFEVGTIMQGVGYFMPSLWIPSFAASQQMPSYTGPLALALFSLSSCFGNLCQGWLCDRFDATVTISMATLGSMVAVFVLWGLATSQPLLYIFAIVWGFTGGGYPATWTGSVKTIRRKGHANLDLGSVISLMAAGKGIGAVVSGPLSERLLEVSPWTDAGFTYGTSYGILVVFTGVSATLGGCAMLGRLLKML